MRLTSTVPEDISNNTDIYAAESLLGGGNLNLTPKERGIEATVVMNKDNILRCFAFANAEMTQASGYLLLGTSEGTNLALTEAQNNTDYSRGALLQGIKRVGNGTCTLRRLP